MNAGHQWKPVWLLVAALILAACSTRTDPGRLLPPSGSRTNGSLTEAPGQAMPVGYVHQPGKAGVRYQAVSHAVLPQWQQQSFGHSLKAFKHSCTRLRVQAGWQGVCRQAMVLPEQSPLAKTFFERYFTPWQVSQNGRLDGMVTGYYEPVLAGDVRQTAKARFPIYGIPNDFVVVPLPVHLRGSKQTVRMNRTGANQGVIAADGAYAVSLAQFPLNDKSTALKGRVEGGAFVPYYTRAQINGGALDGKAPRSSVGVARANQRHSWRLN